MNYGIRHQNRVVPLGVRPIAIGRADNCELRVDFDPLISRRHAIFVAEGGVATVEDLDSRNGVYVNGTRVKGPTPIRVGDRILVGSQELFLEDRADKTTIDQEPDAVAELEGARTLASAPEPRRVPSTLVDFVLIQGREYAVLPKSEYLRLQAAAEGMPTSRRPGAGPVSRRSPPKKKR